MPAPAAVAAPRLVYVDNLRSLAVLSLIAFHTARLFDANPWHMKHAATYPAADLLIAWFNPWFMPLLFLLAGFSAVLALRRRSAGAFVAERFGRLFVPLVAGIFLVVLPQVYLERISPEVPGRQSPIDFDGSLAAFLPRFVECCYPAQNFSYHHLWFVWYLLLYSVLLAPLWRWLARSPAAPARAGDWLAVGWRPLLPMVSLLAVEWALRSRFPSTHDTVHDWANHANFVAVMAIGALLAASPRLMASLARLRRTTLLLGVAAMALMLAGPQLGLTGELRRAARTAAEWLWIAGFLGYAQVWLDRRIPYLTAFGRYAMAFYIVHQAVIVGLGWLSFGWTAAPLAKFLAIAGVATAISLLLPWLADRTPLTRVLLGIKRAPTMTRPAVPEAA